MLFYSSLQKARELKTTILLSGILGHLPKRPQASSFALPRPTFFQIPVDLPNDYSIKNPFFQQVQQKRHFSRLFQFQFFARPFKVEIGLGKMCISRWPLEMSMVHIFFLGKGGDEAILLLLVHLLPKMGASSW